VCSAGPVNRSSPTTTDVPAAEPLPSAHTGRRMDGERTEDRDCREDRPPNSRNWSCSTQGRSWSWLSSRRASFTFCRSPTAAIGATAYDCSAAESAAATTPAAPTATTVITQDYGPKFAGRRRSILAILMSNRPRRLIASRGSNPIASARSRNSTTSMRRCPLSTVATTSGLEGVTWDPSRWRGVAWEQIDLFCQQNNLRVRPGTLSRIA
jgi:hypothetical protein